MKFIKNLFLAFTIFAGNTLIGMEPPRVSKQELPVLEKKINEDANSREAQDRHFTIAFAQVTIDLQDNQLDYKYPPLPALVLSRELVKNRQNEVDAQLNLLLAIGKIEKRGCAQCT